MSDPAFRPDEPDYFIVTRGDGRGSGAGPRHENFGFELTFVEFGAIAFEFSGRRLEARAGEAALLPPGILHTPRAEKLVCRQVVLSKRVVARAAELCDVQVPLAPRLFGGRDRSNGALALVARAHAAGVDTGDPELESLTFALSLAVVREAGVEAPRRERRIERVRAAVADDPARAWTLDELAATAGMSRFAFARAFRDQIGESPLRYVKDRRLERAARVLTESDASVLSVALESGFGDPGRFARAFRARYGVSPRQYRRS